MIEHVNPPKRIPFSSGPGYLLRDAHKSISRALADELGEMGISFKQYFYLRSLFEVDGVSQVELGDAVGMERATVTVMLASMESAGLVRRQRDPLDRRKINVFLTPKAKRLRAPLLATIERQNRLALKGISANEYAQVKATIGKMIANVDAYYKERST
jgi:DNA-binding MarR family transcriptional regulator